MAAAQLTAETPDSKLRRAMTSSSAACAGVWATTSASTRTRSVSSMSTLSRLRRISGPVITSVMDLAGVMIYFGYAYWFLSDLIK